METKGRTIGIKHRVKVTTEGETRPTLVAIKEGPKVVCHELKTETDELDFLLGRFPTSHREATKDDDISTFSPHHLRWRKLGEDEDPKQFPRDFVDKRKDKWYAAQVPETFGGLRSGDIVLMAFGGSGDRLAFALSRHGDEIGAHVLRVPPYKLDQFRGQKGEPSVKSEAELQDTDEGKGKRRKPDPKRNDHKLLITLFGTSPQSFFQIYPRDRGYIAVAESFRAHQDAMRDRITCTQRIRQRLIGRVFLSEDGRYPEGRIEDMFNRAKANDGLLQSLIAAEKELDKRFRSAVNRLDIWNEVMKSLKGFGERHAAGLITAIVDIRRFMGENGAARLTKFCGVHVKEDGSFPRKRRGQRCNWNPTARQSLVLLADQWNYRPDTEWGKRLRENKKNFRQKHPKPVQVEVKDPAARSGKKMVWRYTDGHIHKMAMWRTRTQFIKWLYRQWVGIEERHREQTSTGEAAA